ncbi:myocardin-related transcription factor A isoform X1 [Orcinus orca]|uniref:myocardin-related transcription factor A isoform X1 n=1 Tax=Orcinus orca TaxID=9733 RepID=UPI0021128BE4|nr:myocardin-related transcription factor A isoform X1 [Orcinus orca]XP_049549864.1 myocardin-related transcription factor A isoform X1 [Orcinus orca]
MPWSGWAREPWPLSLCVRSLCSAVGEATTVRGPRTAKKKHNIKQPFEVAITKAKVDFSSVVCLPPSVIAVNGLDGGGAGENDDEPVLVSLSAAPSPQSEAVANELQELSLQPELTLGLHPGRNPNLPPLSERKNVLQLKLQQRRTREELVSQGIMPPLKSPAAFHEQRRSLERARTEDYLKRKIRSRPERSELVRMHILEETSAEPSLQAKQLKLKRARLADDLNEKIAQRPGPMELVEKNILPVESSLKEAIIVGQVNYPKVADSSSFDEDSSDALSPEQPASHESQGSVPSPLEARVSEPLPSATSVSPTQVVSQLPVGPESGETVFLAEQPLPPPSLANGTTVATAKPLPTLIKQSQPKSASEKSQRSKKAKELKPKVKKLKYHQYIPPDQKQDKGAPPMDSSYARILQQQQLFLQLQILNQQQQQHYNYQTILPAPPKPAGEALGSGGAPLTRSLSATSSSSGSGAPGPSGLVRQNSTSLTGKPGALPANLDDMKVAELKQELKLRSLPVSGTKTDLIERLRAYQEQISPATGAPKGPAAASILPKAGEVVVAFPAARLSTGPTLVAAGLAPAEVVVATVTSNGVVKFGSTGSTPPVSPTPSERSLLSTGDENSTPGDTFGEMVTSPVTQLTLQTSPLQILVKEEGPRAGSCCLSPGMRAELEGRDKDQMLQEKDKQIEELTRMLRQKQQLVEWLRLQLEQEKRAQQPTPAPAPALVTLGAAVKQESSLASCQLSRQPPGPDCPFGPSLAGPAAPHVDTCTLGPPAVVVKQEAVLPEPEPAPALVTLGAAVKQESSLASCQLSRQAPGPDRPFGPSLAGPAAHHVDTCTLVPPAVVVKQEAVLPEHEPAPAPQLILGPQGPSLIKGVTPPTLLTDSTGTHLVLTMTNKNADSPGLASGSPQQRGQLSPTKVTLAAGSLLLPPSQPRPFTQPGPQLLSQPGSPAPGPPAQRDLEHPPQPLFGPPTSLPKKEPPGYEEAVSQQPRQQENGSSSQQMDDLFDILIQSGEISADFKEPGKEKSPPRAACGSPLAAQPSPSAELPQAVPPPSGSPALPGRLEDFLESSTGLPLLTGGHEGPEPLSLIDDLHSQMLSSSAILDHPPSPMDTSELHFAPEPSGVGLDLADGHLDGMDWLELSSGGPVLSLAPSTTAPSLFSTDFLDGHDLQLHWDSCL